MRQWAEWSDSSYLCRLPVKASPNCAPRFCGTLAARRLGVQASRISDQRSASGTDQGFAGRAGGGEERRSRESSARDAAARSLQRAASAGCDHGGDHDRRHSEPDLQHVLHREIDLLRQRGQGSRETSSRTIRLCHSSWRPREPFPRPGADSRDSPARRARLLRWRSWLELLAPRPGRRRAACRAVPAPCARRFSCRCRGCG